MARPKKPVPYDPNFLGDGWSVPLPALQGRALESAWNGGKVLDYVHFSLVMNKARHLAIYTACNIDGAHAVRVGRDDDWTTDDRIGAELQVKNDFYKDNPWDRGHLVRRLDPVWGDVAVAKAANAATFCFTNAAPQHERFNQDEWAELEDWVLEHAVSSSYRCSVLTGPIFRDTDKVYRGVKIPAAFWKIIVARDANSDGAGLMATAFLMKQDELWHDTAGAQLNHLTTYQVRVADIERFTCLDFGDLRAADPLSWVVDRKGRSLDTASGWRRVHNPGDLVVWEDNTPAGERRLRAPSRARSGGGCGCSGAPVDPVVTLDRLSQRVTADVDSLGERLARMEKFIASLPNDLGKPFQRSNKTFRIVGGVRVDEGEYEDCVCVGDNQGYFCTGVLIGPNMVLTAGHCVDDAVTRIQIGRSIWDDTSPVTYGVRRVVRHPDYNLEFASRTGPRNDISILILDRDVAGVAPVGITDPAVVAVDPDGRFDDPMVRLVGFGNTDRAASYGFGIKREVDVPIIALQQSAADNEREAAQRYAFHPATEFAAGLQDRDTCTGDSGGPAYYLTPGTQGKERNVLGLTSRSVAGARWDCGDGGVYTLVWPYKAWIESVAAANSGKLSWSTAPVVPPPDNKPENKEGEGGGGSFEPGCC